MIYVCKADNVAYRSWFVVKSANLAHNRLSCQTRILVGYLVGLVTKQLCGLNCLGGLVLPLDIPWQKCPVHMTYVNNWSRNYAWVSVLKNSHLKNTTYCREIKLETNGFTSVLVGFYGSTEQRRSFKEAILSHSILRITCWKCFQSTTDSYAKL